jgi:hypothetical protein
VPACLAFDNIPDTPVVVETVQEMKPPGAIYPIGKTKNTLKGHAMGHPEDEAAVARYEFIEPDHVLIGIYSMLKALILQNCIVTS